MGARFLDKPNTAHNLNGGPIHIGDVKASPDSFKRDSWANFASGLGVNGIDGVQNMTPTQPLRGTEPVFNNMWRGDGFARKIVEQPVYDGMRAGYTFDGLDNVKERIIKKRFHDLYAEGTFRNWWRWGRLHGGSVIFMGINDGNTDLSIPFDPTRSDYKIMFLKVFDRWRVNPMPELDMDPTSPTFGQVMIYRIAPLSGGAFNVHRSRLIVYDGEPVTDTERLRLNRWGDSCLQPCFTSIRSLRNVLMNCDSIVSDFVQGILKVDNLLNMIQEGQEVDLLMRLRMMDLTKSTNRTILIGTDEDYSRITSNIAGLEHLIDKFAEALSGESGIPVKLLFGVAPKGLNATGDADIRQWYDAVLSQQRGRYEPAIRQLADAIAGEQNFDLGDYEIKFNPLWQQSQLEFAQTYLANAQADTQYFTMNALSAEEIRDMRFSRPDYGYQINGIGIEDGDKLADDLPPDSAGKPAPAGVGHTGDPLTSSAENLGMAGATGVGIVGTQQG